MFARPRRPPEEAWPDLWLCLSCPSRRLPHLKDKEKESESDHAAKRPEQPREVLFPLPVPTRGALSPPRWGDGTEQTVWR